jgi:hypothetical protein
MKRPIALASNYPQLPWVTGIQFSSSWTHLLQLFLSSRKKEAVMATRVPHPLHGCGSKLLPSVMVAGRVFSLSFLHPPRRRWWVGFCIWRWQRRQGSSWAKALPLEAARLPSSSWWQRQGEIWILKKLWRMLVLKKFIFWNLNCNLLREFFLAWSALFYFTWGGKVQSWSSWSIYSLSNGWNCASNLSNTSGAVAPCVTEILIKFLKL